MSQETSEWHLTNFLYGYADTRGLPWWENDELRQQLGLETNIYPGAIPVKDVLSRLFHWQAEEAPAAYLRPASFEDCDFIYDGQPFRVVVDPLRKAIVPSDSDYNFSFFKQGFQIHQYSEWLIDNVAGLVGTNRHELQIGSAGLLKQRAQAWTCLGLPEWIKTPEGFTFAPNIILYTSLDGTFSSAAILTAQAAICDNTLFMARTEASKTGRIYNIRHSKNSGFRVADAREALGIVEQASEDFAADIKGLAEWDVTEKDWDSLLDVLVPIPVGGKTTQGETMAKNKRDQISALYVSDPRVSPWKGTALGALQAFNTYEQHEKGIRVGQDRPELNMAKVLKGESAKHDAEVLNSLRLVTAGA